MSNYKQKYKNIVSLGWFCSTALELERIGLRSASYPFDWVLCPCFEKVIEMIESDFKDLEDAFQGNEMYQYLSEPKYYYNPKLQFHFYHDFIANQSIEKQLPKVKEKYIRRAQRFMDISSEPTLYIRYISDQKDFDWISNHMKRIQRAIKKRCSSSEIIFIGNDDLVYNEQDIHVYKVKKDSQDTVARQFLLTLLDQHIDLGSDLKYSYYNQEQIDENLRIYYLKQKKKTTWSKRITQRGKKILSKLHRSYIHYNSYS